MADGSDSSSSPAAEMAVDLEQILEAAGEGIYGLDREGMTTFVNPAAERMLGYSRGELLGLNQHAVIHHSRPDGAVYPAETCPIYASIARGEASTVATDVFWRKDGSSFPVEFTTTPIVQHGEVVGGVVTFRDITDRLEASVRTRALIAAETAREAAEQAEQRVRGILESITDGFFAMDRGFRLLHVNSAACRLLGRERERLEGRVLFDEFPEAVDTEFHRAYARALETGEPQRFEAFYEPFDAHYDVRAYPSDEGISVFFREITEEKRNQAALRDSERRYRFLIDMIPQQVWTALPDGQLNYVSQRVVDYFQKPAETIVGEGWKDVIHPDDLERVVERWSHSLTSGEPYEVEFRLLRPDGTFRWHLGRAEALRDPDRTEVVAWFGTNTDMNDLKEAEAERDRALVDLRRSNEELDRFAYVASHDLKAPLRGIASLVEWLRADLGEDLPAEAREHLSIMEGRVQRLEGLIDGLLLYARAGRDAPEERVDLRALVEEIFELVAPPEHFELVLEGELPELWTNRGALQQALMNLIGNAIKHNHAPAPRVTVTGGRLELDGEPHVEILVVDNGPGIEPRFRERIFQIFQTLQSRDTLESTGIGLAIVKKIVTARGGSITVESGAEGGAAFRLRWPL